MAAIGEDSSRQDMKKKHAVGKDRRRGGHEVPRGFEPRSLDSESSVLTVDTTGPADGSDRTRDLSLGSAGRDQVLQHTVSGACWRGLHPMKKGRKKHRGS